MTMTLLVLLNASIFSLNGIGEDLSIFRTPFLEVDQRTNIEFVLRPEFNILNESGSYRSIFWTNHFNFNLTAPLTKGLTMGIGNFERFDQSYDIYFDENDLKMHLIGKGGIEEFYANLNTNFRIGEIALRGSYLLGNAREIWNYDISNYVLTDTFLYKYHGKILCGGLRLDIISISYEGFGNIIMERVNSDTTIDLPERLSIGLSPYFGNSKINLMFERSFWQKGNNYISPNRFKIGFIKDRFALNYRYNPWYLDYVKEHGLDFSLLMPIKNLGSATLSLHCSLRSKGSLREFNIIPEFKFALREIFSRRR